MSDVEDTLWRMRALRQLALDNSVPYALFSFQNDTFELKRAREDAQRLDLKRVAAVDAVLERTGFLQQALSRAPSTYEDRLQG